MKPRSITRALALGIKFIQNRQNINGQFKNQGTIFYHALVFLSLSDLRIPRTDEVIKRLGKFLAKHKSLTWSFNYWVNPSEHPLSERYPDDWDDTACVLAALSQSNKPLSGEALACAIKNLTALEENKGGPYFTWIIADKSAQELDIVVNSNIAYFLSLYNAFPKGLHDFLRKKISRGQFSSPYYVGKLPVLYFLSRGIKTKNGTKLIGYLNSKEISPKNPQEVALRVCALLNLKFPTGKLKKDIGYLVSRQKNDGSWEAEAFGVERILNGKKYFSACNIFTTALCLEALNKYSQSLRKEDDDKEKRFYSQAVHLAQKRIGSQPRELRELLLSALSCLLVDCPDKDIVLLPFWTNYILKPKKRITRKILLQLAEANLYGWMAYRIYDDLLDNQGLAKTLPAANWSFLHLCQPYLSLGIINSKISRIFSLTLEKIEAANAWEQTYSRLPTFKRSPPLAQKSFGAALPALIPLLLGQSPSSYRQMEKFFWNYLSARQLNDDAHDWREDLSRGQVNFAAALLLAKFKKRPLGLPEDLTALQKLFWHKILPLVAQKTENHLKLARDSLKQLPVGKYHHRLENMLLVLEQATLAARKGRAQTVEFLEHYKTLERD